MLNKNMAIDILKKIDLIVLLQKNNFAKKCT